MRQGLALIAAVAALPAAAPAGTTCTFTQECYMADGCADTDWEVTVDPEAGVITTIAETWEILPADLAEPRQIVALGNGALALLTIGPEASAMSVHIAEGPTVLTYFGECTTP